MALIHFYICCTYPMPMASLIKIENVCCVSRNFLFVYGLWYLERARRLYCTSQAQHINPNTSIALFAEWILHLVSRSRSQTNCSQYRSIILRELSSNSLGLPPARLAAVQSSQIGFHINMLRPFTPELVDAKGICRSCKLSHTCEVFEKNISDSIVY